MRAARLTALALSACLLGAVSTASAATTDPAPSNPFSTTSVWNAPIPDSAPLSSNSSTLVSNLVYQVQAYVPWINSRKWSTPVYQVGARQKTVSVVVDPGTAMYTNPTDADNLAQQLSTVPIPSSAQPSPDLDSHLIIWQPSTDTEWEMWLVSKQTAPNGGTQWHAGWGARIEHVSQSSGIVPNPFGATASGLSQLGGLMTADEISAPAINHALALALPDVEGWGYFVWPANRTDGSSAASDAIPEGTRFRLDSNLNVSSLGLPPIAQAMALAAQRYGIIVRDKAGAVTFYAEQPSDVGLYDYNWNGMDPAHLLASFPWSQLQVVAPPTPGTSGATTARTHRKHGHRRATHGRRARR